MKQKTDTQSVQPDLEKEIGEPSTTEASKNKTEKNKWKQVREKAPEDEVSSALEEGSDIPKDKEPTNIDEDKVSHTTYVALQEENQALQIKLEEAKKAILYVEAEKQTNARRHQHDLQKAKLYSGSDTVSAFISLLDSLEAANLQSGEASLEQLKEGTQNILDLVTSIFKKLGVTEISAEIGETFDPSMHSAVATEIAENSEQTTDTIIKVLRKGYRLHERVLRPAMVIISQKEE